MVLYYDGVGPYNDIDAFLNYSNVLGADFGIGNHLECIGDIIFSQRNKKIEYVIKSYRSSDTKSTKL